MLKSVVGAHGASPGARFALAKFRPTALPTTLVTRPGLHDRLIAGAAKRLTVVVGSAGAGKSVLLSSWVAARPPGRTSWLSCDRADADPVRFWTGFIEAAQFLAPGFGADAADLLAMDKAMSADVTASIANDAAHLPAGSAVIVDDYHAAAAAVSGDMTDLVACWPAGTAQLILASRVDPSLRLHRLRMASELCELRDRDLYFSLRECGDLLANFGVQVAVSDLALLHQRSEGWAAALQMVALSLRTTTDPVRAVRALDVRSQAIAEYFIDEVLAQQPAEVAQFMLETSILGELTVGACEAVTGHQDAAALLHRIHAANLFLVPLDDGGTSFRYHHLVRQVLRAELRARDRAHEQKLQLLVAEWLEGAGDTRRAARHFLAAQHADRALALLQDRVVSDYLHDPVTPAPLDLTMIDAALFTDDPDQLLGLAFDLLLSGDVGQGSEFLDMVDHAGPQIMPGSRLAGRAAVVQCFRCALTGQLDEAVGHALTARAIGDHRPLGDEWDAVVPLVLLRVYPCLEDLKAVEREAAATLAIPGLPEPARLILVPSARALAWFEAGRLSDAADAAAAAEQQARRLGFGQHFFAVDYLRTLAGLALERRDLDTAERLTEQVLSISERRRPLFEFHALLDRAAIWAAHGQVREALATVETARLVLGGAASPVLRARADELEALLRLLLGDLPSATELASGLPASRRSLLRARIALAAGDHLSARAHLQDPPPAELFPRRAFVRQILLAAAAIERRDPAAAGILGGAIQTARREGFLNTAVTTAPQVTSYLVEHAPQMRPDPFTEQLIAAALQVRSTHADGSQSRRGVTQQLTPAELRILKLLPTSTYLQIAATLYISRNTVKTQLRSVYQKLGVTSRAQAIERAVELRLI